MRNFHLNGPRGRHLLEARKGYESSIAIWRLGLGTKINTATKSWISEHQIWVAKGEAMVTSSPMRKRRRRAYGAIWLPHRWRSRDLASAAMFWSSLSSAPPTVQRCSSLWPDKIRLFRTTVARRASKIHQNLHQEERKWRRKEHKICWFCTQDGVLGRTSSCAWQRTGGGVRACAERVVCSW
jgi:hypothetical protein